MTPPIIIDLEASGFGKGSYPIEVGYADAQGKTWCSLIKPLTDWQHWDTEAARLHNIPRERLFQFGKEASAIAMHLNEVFLHQTIYSDGWMNDYIWLSKLFDQAGTAPHFKLEDLAQILTSQQQDIWHETKQSINDKLKLDRHRASNDAKLLQLTWIKTAEMAVPV